MLHASTRPELLRHSGRMETRKDPHPPSPPPQPFLRLTNFQIFKFFIFFLVSEATWTWCGEKPCVIRSISGITALRS